MQKPILILLSLITSIVSFSQNLGFAPLPNYPGVGRDDASAFVIGSKAYVGIGYLSGFILGEDFYCFDTNTNSWSEVAKFPPEPRMYATSFSINGYGYVVGGIGSNNAIYTDVWQYNPANNSWTEHQTSLPGSLRRGMQSAVWDNNAYIFFGKDTYNLYNEVWKFNGNSWTQLADFPSIARFQSADVQLDSIIYFVSGYDLSIVTPEVWQFNLESETWTQLVDFPGEARWYARGFHYDNKIYMGTGWAANYLDDFWSYDPVTQIWASAPALSGEFRKGMVSFNVGSRAFIGMGTKSAGQRDSKFWEFVANAGFTESIDIPCSIYPNPTCDFLYINLSQTNKSTMYKIIDISGKEIKKGFLQSSVGMIETSEMSDGIYHLILTSNGMSHTEKFCIQSR